MRRAAPALAQSGRRASRDAEPGTQYPDGMMAVIRWLLLCLVACSGGSSDEDQLEQFVRDVTGEVDDALVGRALGYTEFAEVPVDVRAPGYAGVYRDDRAEEIEQAFRRAMQRFFWGDKLRVRSHQIEIDGSHADVGMRLLTSKGPLRVETALEKTAAGWKVSKVHVERGL